MSSVHRKQWNDDLIKSELLRVANTLSINHCPTFKEIRMVTGDYSLTNKISKTGGYKYWSKVVNLPLKESDTNFGNEHEDEIRNLLISKGYKTDDMTTNHKYDLLVNNFVRVDVKASKLYHGVNGSSYSFNLEGKYHDCDIFFLRCIDDDGNIRELIVPVANVMGQGQISVGGTKSKWYEYLDRYDYIDKYIKFYNEF